MAFYGNLSGHVVPESEMRLNYTRWCPKKCQVRGVLHEPIRGLLLIPSSPPDSLLNLCVFPSHREGLGMGIQNGMGEGAALNVGDG